MLLPLRTDSPLRTTPYMNWAIIAANVAMFVAQKLRPEVTDALQLYAHGPALYQFITYAFLHGGLLHIVGNMLFLYLFENNVWAKWAKNVAALPSDDKSLFIRAYLDQGRRHPRELKGHRTATVLQRIVDFNERQARRPFTSFWEVSTEKLLGDPVL